MATYPLTRIKIAPTSCLLIKRLRTSHTARLIVPRRYSFFMISAAILPFIQQVILSFVNVPAIAQKPAFAHEGLPIANLPFLSLFHHSQDFNFIAFLMVI